MYPIKKLPDWEELVDRFEYLPHTGQLIHKPCELKYFKNQRVCTRHNNHIAGTEAGYLETRGKHPNNQTIRCVKISNKVYLAHRLIWKWVTGEDPGRLIDHLDGDTLNNKFSNFRNTSATINQRNRVKNSNNTSGHTGVRKVGNRWRASASKYGTAVHLGYFDTPEEAAYARKQWQTTNNYTDRHGQEERKYVKHRSNFTREVAVANRPDREDRRPSPQESTHGCSEMFACLSTS